MGALVLTVFLAAGQPRALGPGLAYRELAGPSFTLAVMEVDPARAGLRVLDARRFGRPALTAREFAERSGAVAVVNASFFDDRTTPLGLVVSDREVRNPPRRSGWGIFFVSGGRARIVGPGGFSVSRSIEQAVQVGPRLVSGGRVTRLKPQSARRSVVGVDRAGHVYLAVTTRGEADASELAALLARPPAEGGLGLVDALNLDGGGSTQLHLRAAGFEQDERGIWPVPIAIGVFPRP
ncbi:MAG TPA: phosphodiester glycosidase family protein [Vicinamibacteria bacterium]